MNTSFSFDVHSMEECVKFRNLFLIHVGHSWCVIRAIGDYCGGAIPLPELNKRFPKAAMINTIARIEDVDTLKKYLEAARIDVSVLIERLNKPHDESGYDEVLGV